MFFGLGRTLAARTAACSVGRDIPHLSVPKPASKAGSYTTNPTSLEVGFFFEEPVSATHDTEGARERHRRTARENRGLIDLIAEFHPATAYPQLNATDREIGAWLGVQDLLRRLVILRDEDSGEIPDVLRRPC